MLKKSFKSLALLRRATTDIGSVGSTGLARWIWNPADNARSRSSSLRYAVIATDGTLVLNILQHTYLFD